jgi:hypothetical protein
LAQLVQKTRFCSSDADLAWSFAERETVTVYIVQASVMEKAMPVAVVAPLDSKHLLPNAEAAKHAVQQVVRVNGSNHFAQLVQGAAQLRGQEFGRILVERQAMRLAQVF